MVAISMVICALCALIMNTEEIAISCLIFSTVAFATAVTIHNLCKDQPTGRYEYQVKINESVSLTTFYEKYEIIDQNGKSGLYGRKKMSGINILSRTDIMVTVDWAKWVMGVLLVILLVSLVATIVASSWPEHKMLQFILATVFIIVFICCWIWAIISPSVPNGRYKYKATIDDTVSFRDVYNNYEVVGQDGDIWILEDKCNTNQNH